MAALKAPEKRVGGCWALGPFRTYETHGAVGVDDTGSFVPLRSMIAESYAVAPTARASWRHTGSHGKSIGKCNTIRRTERLDLHRELHHNVVTWAAAHAVPAARRRNRFREASTLS